VDKINEQSSAYYTVSFLDKDGLPAEPASVVYSVRCVPDDSEIRTNTAVTPSSTILIHLDSSDTAIQDSTRDTEVHLLTVIGTYGANDKVTAEREFMVANLAGVS
jgi:hypothetical protein